MAAIISIQELMCISLILIDNGTFFVLSKQFLIRFAFNSNIDINFNMETK